MRFLIVVSLAIFSASAFSCDRVSAENLVKHSIVQSLVGDEVVRTMKMGTVSLEEKSERIWAVHAVVEMERFGRKTSEQAVVFRFDENCHVVGSSGASIKKVTF